MQKNLQTFITKVCQMTIALANPHLNHLHQIELSTLKCTEMAVTEKPQEECKFSSLSFAVAVNVRMGRWVSEARISQ